MIFCNLKILGPSRALWMFRSIKQCLAIFLFSFSKDPFSYKKLLMSLGVAIWGEWWVWFCSRDFWYYACTLLTWSGVTSPYSPISISWCESSILFKIDRGSGGDLNSIYICGFTFLIKISCYFTVIDQKQRKSELSIFRLCFSLSSYLYFLVTKKSLRLQVDVQNFTQ